MCNHTYETNEVNEIGNTEYKGEDIFNPIFKEHLNPP